MSTIGAVAHSVCNPWHEAPARIATERERTAIYYVAVFAEIERCRVAQVPTLLGERSIPLAPTTRIPYAVMATDAETPSGEAQHTCRLFIRRTGWDRDCPACMKARAQGVGA